MRQKNLRSKLKISLCFIHINSLSSSGMLEHTQEIQQSPGSLGSDVNAGRELAAFSTSLTEQDFHLFDCISL